MHALLSYHGLIPRIDVIYVLAKSKVEFPLFFLFPFRVCAWLVAFLHSKKRRCPGELSMMMMRVEPRGNYTRPEPLK